MSDEEAWNSDRLSTQFRFRAQDALSYSQQCRRRAPANSSYKRLYDDATATYFANDYFVDRAFLSSRRALVEELERVRNREWVPDGVYDRARYLDQWRREIDSWLALYRRAEEA